jgi:hypothetical protein
VLEWVTFAGEYWSSRFLAFTDHICVSFAGAAWASDMVPSITITIWTNSSLASYDYYGVNSTGIAFLAFDINLSKGIATTTPLFPTAVTLGASIKRHCPITELLKPNSGVTDK